VLQDVVFLKSCNKRTRKCSAKQLSCRVHKSFCPHPVITQFEKCKTKGKRCQTKTCCKFQKTCIEGSCRVSKMFCHSHRFPCKVAKLRDYTTCSKGKVGRCSALNCCNFREKCFEGHCSSKKRNCFRKSLYCPPPPPPPRRTRTCYLVADPHASSFDGARFDAQTVGDWVFYKGPHLEASYRGKSMGRWVGAVQWVVRVHHNLIKSIGFNQVSINGHVHNIAKAGTKNLNAGTQVVMTGNRVTISSKGEAVDFYAYGYYFNLYARSDKRADRISGICAHQMLHSGDFGTVKRPKIVHFPHRHCAKKAHYTRVCQRRKLRGVLLRNCVFDLCAHTPKNVVFKIRKEMGRAKKKEKLVNIEKLTLFVEL